MLTFEKIIKQPQFVLKDSLISELNYMGYKTITKKGFTYASGNVPVMLVAHLDTVHKELVKTICYSPDGKILMSPQGIGGDDRAGIYMILQIIKQHRCHVLFCEDEEAGGGGALEFVKSKITPKVNYIVELDRRGIDDAVFYDCDNPEFTKFICRLGFKEDFGSFSDISIIAPELDIAAVNISAGYYNEHTKHEYIHMDAVDKNIQRIGKVVSTTSSKFDYIEAMGYSRHGVGYGVYHYNSNRKHSRKESSEIKRLKLSARQFGFYDDEVDLLLAHGYCPDEIEYMLNFPHEFNQSLDEIMFENAYGGEL